MEDTGGGGSVSTIEHGGMTISSVGQSAADSKATLAMLKADDAEAAPEKDAKPDKPAKRTISDSARDLGKRGGKAAAEKRAEARDAVAEPQGDGGRAEGTRKATEAGIDPEAQEGEQPAGEEDDDAPLGKRSQRRLEVATRKEAAAKREAAEARQALERERQRYEAELAAYRVRGDRPGEGPKGADERTPPRTSAPDVQGKPREEDFESFSEYLDARDKYNRDQWEGEQQRRHFAAQAVDTVKSHVSEFFAGLMPGWREEIDPELQEARPYFLLEDGEQPGPYAGLITEAIRLKRQGPGVLKYLSDNLDELQRLRALTSQEDLRVEMRVIAKTLGSKPDATAGEPPGEGDRAPKRETSKANPPVRPVTGAPHVAEGDAGPRAGEEFDSWYRRQKRA